MHYLHTMVRVKNLDEALDFYCGKLGLVEVNRRDEEKGKYTNVFLKAPGDDVDMEGKRAPLLELTYNWEEETYTGGRNFGHLAYAVEDIYEYCKNLMEKGIIINRPPRDGRMAFIKSPDGISIELLQIGEALAAAEPWASMPSTGTW
jgi:lactoylglutathione lyase